MRAGALRVALALVALGVALPAAAQDGFEAAERARAEARLEDAERLYDEALESGQLGLSEVAHAHLRLAELAYLGEELGAGERHLRYALALRPDAPVSDGPQSMQDAAAAILVERSQRTMRVVLEISDPSAPIAIAMRDAPDGLVRTVLVAGPEGWRRTIAYEGEERLEVSPPQASRPIGVRLLDRHGNALGSAGAWPAPPAEVVVAPTAPAPVTAEPPPEEEEDGEEVFENPWFWVAIGVVAVIAVVAIAFTASGDSYSLGPPVAP